MTMKSEIGSDRINLGLHYTHMVRHDPKKLLFVLSHYKFAAKLIGEGKSVLDVGCSEGLGSCILAEKAKRVWGIDFDEEAIDNAIENFSSNKIRFIAGDIMKIERIGVFDAVVAFDVIEHIYPSKEKKFMDSLSKNLIHGGVYVIGTPNKTAKKYASKTSEEGHINLYTHDKLRILMKRYFNQVFIFSCNDEVIHTGFYPMAQYLIAVGIGKKG
jgi:2-polyprenyl-3-methyl-5-hydroxy-6-metoxy-1,4-benzoquinol methylase